MPSNVAATRDGGSPTVATDQVMDEPRVAERGEGFREDARSPVRSDVERLEEHGHDRGRRVGRGRPGHAVETLHRDIGRDRPRRERGARPVRAAGDQQQPVADDLEAVGREARDQVGWFVMRRRRPNVRLAADRREHDSDLGEPTVERDGVGRPADRLDAVPERLGLLGVVQKDRVAEVAQRAAGDGVDLSLVAE